MALSVMEASKRRGGLAPANNQVFRQGQDMASRAPSASKSAVSQPVKRVTRKVR
jgi:hypothetical protein